MPDGSYGHRDEILSQANERVDIYEQGQVEVADAMPSVIVTHIETPQESLSPLPSPPNGRMASSLEDATTRAS